MKRRSFIQLLLGATGLGCLAKGALAHCPDKVIGFGDGIKGVRFPTPITELKKVGDKELLVVTEDGAEFLFDGSTRFEKVWEDPPGSGIYWGYDRHPLRFELTPQGWDKFEPGFYRAGPEDILKPLKPR